MSTQAARKRTRIASLADDRLTLFNRLVDATREAIDYVVGSIGSRVASIQ